MSNSRSFGKVIKERNRENKTVAIRAIGQSIARRFLRSSAFKAMSYETGILLSGLIGGIIVGGIIFGVVGWFIGVEHGARDCEQDMYGRGR